MSVYDLLPLLSVPHASGAVLKRLKLSPTIVVVHITSLTVAVYLPQRRYLYHFYAVSILESVCNVHNALCKRQKGVANFESMLVVFSVSVCSRFSC